MKNLETITGSELLNKEIKELPYIVNEIMPAGLIMLAGSAKAGKSWFALSLCVNVAKGEKVLGFDVKKSDTLYLALEDNETRLQSRLLELTEDEINNIYFSTEIAKLGGELENKLISFIQMHPKIGLIVIDTFQKVRPAHREIGYATDYTDLEKLKKISDKYQIAIVLIHHFRKQKDQDSFHQITGSTALQGATDLMITMNQKSRGSKTAMMNFIGRDVEVRELEVRRNENCVWELVNDSMSEMSIENSKLVEAIKKFMNQNNQFIGTATDLSTLINLYSDNKFNERSISKKLKNISESLKKYGIIVTYRRSNGKRLIDIQYLSDDSDTKIEHL